MSSIRRINASRANGACSRGPVTPAGKARSAANATTHGLLARAAVLDAESKPAFEALLNDFVAVFRPSNTVELTLVEEMAVCTWRQRRCWAMETRTVNLAAGRNGAPSVSSIAAAYAELAETPGLNLVHRYEARVHRMYQRALNNLLLLRQCNESPNEPIPNSEHGLPPDQPLDEDPIAQPEPEPDPEPAPNPVASTPAPDPKPVPDREGPAAEPAPAPPKLAPWMSSVLPLLIP